MRRYRTLPCKEVVFALEKFLANDSNKRCLIDHLRFSFRTEGIQKRGKHKRMQYETLLKQLFKKYTTKMFWLFERM